MDSTSPKAPHIKTKAPPTPWKKRSSAAAEVFGLKGYGGATIKEASLYRNFKSKEALLLSVPGNRFDAPAEELERVFSGALNQYERLLCLVMRMRMTPPQTLQVGVHGLLREVSDVSRYGGNFFAGRESPDIRVLKGRENR
jgi:AcrR family transcriptional regulator